MKNFFILFIAAFLITSCDKSNYNINPYLSDFPFTAELNLNLPQYSNLLHPSGSVRLLGPYYGPRGIIVFNAGINNYVAYDVACPNHEFKSCSIMELKGAQAICPCDDLSYSLFTGIHDNNSYPLKQYRVEVVGNILRVYN